MSLAEEVNALLPQGLVTGYMGVVKSVDANGKPTVDVRGTLLTVSCAASYYPVAGDSVFLIRADNSNSWVAAFKIASGNPYPWVNGTPSNGNAGTFKFRWLVPGVTVQYSIGLTLAVAGKGSGTAMGVVPAEFGPAVTSDGLLFAVNATIAGGQVPHAFIGTDRVMISYGLDSAGSAFGQGIYAIRAG